MAEHAFQASRLDPLDPACEACGQPHGRIPAEEKSGNRDGRGRFGGGNTAGTGAASWLTKIRRDLRDGVPLAQATLMRVMKGGTDKDATSAAKVWLEFSVPKPKQTHRVEGRNGDPLGVLTPEQLVAFITGKKEGA